MSLQRAFLGECFVAMLTSKRVDSIVHTNVNIKAGLVPVSLTTNFTNVWPCYPMCLQNMRFQTRLVSEFFFAFGAFVRFLLFFLLFRKLFVLTIQLTVIYKQIIMDCAFAAYRRRHKKSIHTLSHPTPLLDHHRLMVHPIHHLQHGHPVRSSYLFLCHHQS